MIAKLAAVADCNFNDLQLSDALENQLRRADLFTRGVVACCAKLLENQDIDGEQTGLFISTAYGPMQCNLDVLDFLVEEEPVSPTLFSHSVFNGASGYLARIFAIHGPALTQTSYSYPFFTALSQAKFALEQKQLSHAIIIQAETYATLLEDAKSDNQTTWPSGAIAWLLSPDGVDIQQIEVAEIPCTPQVRLQFAATSSTDQKHQHPLSMGLELNELFRTGTLPAQYEIASDFGKVHLAFGMQS